MQWGARARVWAIVWAVMQLALPAVATYADAGLERESERSSAHVESSSRASCPRVHPADCALCQLVFRTAEPTQAVVSPVQVPLTALPPADARIDRAADALAHLPPARGPPLS